MLRGTVHPCSSQTFGLAVNLEVGTMVLLSR